MAIFVKKIVESGQRKSKWDKLSQIQNYNEKMGQRLNFCDNLDKIDKIRMKMLKYSASFVMNNVLKNICFKNIPFRLLNLSAIM